MKALQKKLATVFLALAMSLLLAVPVFAQNYGVRNSWDNGEIFTLNINGATGSAYQNRSLNIWKISEFETGPDQNFEFSYAGNNSWYMCPIHHTDYAINRASSSGKAIIWPVSTGSADSKLYQQPYDGANYYEFELANPLYSGQKLSVASSLYDWSPCYFKPVMSGWTCQWVTISSY